MALTVVNRRNPASYIQDYIDQYVQNRDRGRSLDIQQQAVDDERTYKTGLLDEGGKRLDAAKNEKGFNEWKTAVFDPLVKAGRVEEAFKAAITYKQSGGGGEYAGGVAQGRPSTDLDTAAANTAAYTKNQTGIAASGSQDVQARNFTNKLATNEQLSESAFGDQQQRQPEAARPPKDQSPAAQDAYNAYLRRRAGDMTTAGQDQQSSTQLTMNREDNANLMEREKLGIASNERIAGQKTDAKGDAGDAGADYADERRVRVLDSVNELAGRVNYKTVGAGALMGKIPGTDAKDFATDLDTLKANIAFGELAEMRAASKTGGALGQVSDKESELLSATLGGLDQKQSPENMKKNLAKVAASLARWEEAKAKMQGGGTKQLDEATASTFLEQAGGDKQKARAMAKAAGYSF
jgi:hypothetical protein